MNIDQRDIEQYLSEVKDAVENDRYRLDRNVRRQDNINLFLDYVIDEAKAKEIILSLTVMDFSEILQNEHKGYEHEKLYVFGVNHFFCVIDSYWLRTPPLTEPARNAAA